MLIFSGAAYQAGMAGISPATTSVVKATVGSRSALTCTAGSGTYRAWWQNQATCPSAGVVGASTDVVPRALAVDAWLAFSTLSLASGATSDVLHLATTDAATSSAGTRQMYLRAYYNGSAYRLVLQSGVDSATLGTIAADSAYHTVSLWVFKDKVFHQFDSGTVGNATWTAAQSGTIFPVYPVMIWTGGACIAAWDALRMAVEEYPLSATAGASETNGHADDGALYLIEKTALAGLVTAGTAYELAVTAGAFTESATANKDYLCCKVGSDNNSGYGVKLKKSAAGAWTKSAWSLS